MGKLVLFHADGSAQDVKLGRERVTIGRRPDNDVCLPQPAVSGEHAAVVTILDDSFLEDLGSTNGTLVNGKPISKHFLRDRDEIDIGREILVYLVDNSAKLDKPPRRPERPVVAGSGDAATPDSAARPAAQGAQHDKRRSDGLMAISGPDVDAMQRVVAAEIEGGAPESSTRAPELAETSSASAPPVELPEPQPAIRVLSGSGSGRVVSLAESETLIGRAGVQVVALRRTADEIRVVPIEGATPPNINGNPVPPDGQRLAAGDILEIAGSTLELVLPSDAAG